MGNVQKVGIQMVRMQALQGLGDVQMDALAPRRTGISVEDMPDQWVCELEERSVIDEYPLVHTFL